MIPTFAPYPGGLGIWQDGQLLAVIPKDRLPRLIEIAAQAMQRDPFDVAMRDVKPSDLICD